MSRIIKRIEKPYRFVSTVRFYGYLKKALGGVKWMSLNGRKKLVSKKFGERIFLAVTSVNGCRYCSYYHAKLALTSGMERTEISAMLSGDLGDVPEEEAVALAFAQHYAESGGQPDPQALSKLVECYGLDGANVIRSHISMITVGNFYGTAFDALQSRLRLRPIAGSRLMNELGITFGSILMLPVMLLDLLFSLPGRKRAIA